MKHAKWIKIDFYFHVFNNILAELSRALQIARTNKPLQANPKDTHQKRHPVYPTIKEALQHEKSKQKKKMPHWMMISTRMILTLT